MLRGVTKRWRLFIMLAAVATAAATAGCGDDAKHRDQRDVSDAAARQLRLTRTLPESYRRVCDDLAAYAPRVRACPPLIPAGALEVDDARPFSTKAALRGGWSSAYEGEGGRWRFDVAWTSAVKDRLVTHGVEGERDDPRSDCHWGQLSGQRVEACQVLPFEAGGGASAGQVAYVWPHGAASYVVSAPDGPRARAMTQALIAKTATDT